MVWMLVFLAFLMKEEYTCFKTESKIDLVNSLDALFKKAKASIWISTSLVEDQTLTTAITKFFMILLKLK
ncbi:hypothetical protein WICPIJ_000121 [Wickerhamomyces pijperi]|uniref:Uncharacterized protein n=1 Tax=Wickerhamomyces pijperi TaxID=599730 RepID=A0A9P8QEK9_WICPI|nr:hypothetical protein WICPIJ_000121 [Wickerhamomyces pijperi]